MPNYAISDGSTIVNMVVADSKEIVESIFNMEAIEDDGKIGIGWYFEDNVWKSPKPYPSWEWVDGDWQAPVPKPDEEYKYFWNEETMSWERPEYA